MNAEVGDSARLRTLGKPLKIGRRDPEDFDGIGQAKPEEGFSKTVIAPADHNQHREDERRNRHADELKSEKGAGTSRDQAEQHPEDATGHRLVTPRRRYPGRISNTGCRMASASNRSTGSSGLASK